MKASQKWKIERILYLALIPISYWFILFFLSSYSDVNSLNISLSTTTNKILLLIFLSYQCFILEFNWAKFMRIIFN